MLTRVSKWFFYNLVLRQRFQRRVNRAIHPLYRPFYWILNTSRDYMAIDLKSKDPKLFNLKDSKRDYLFIQRLGATNKIGRISKGRREIHQGRPTNKIVLISNRLKEEFPQRILKGVCHGVRTGVENNWLISQLPTGSEVIGTDIYSGIGNVPNCIEWNFHDMKPEWDGALDFVYCNSLDQSNKPLDAIFAWLKSLKIGSGILFLDIGRHTGKAGNTLLDPFSLEPEIAPFFILKHFKGCSIKKANFPHTDDFRTVILELSRDETLSPRIP